MSVDKFGRHLHRKSRYQKGPKGEGYKLTSEGDYDIQNKRMRYVEDAVENGDAVNLKTMNTGLLNCMQLTSDKKFFDAQFKRIGNAIDPVDATDLVTKSYLEYKVPIHSESRKSYSVHQYQVKDVAYPMDSGDAVNVNYVKNNCLVRSEPKIFDGDGGTISNIRDPIKGSEVATKTYVDFKTPAQFGGYWSFANKRLVNITNPINDWDAVTLNYFKRNTLCMNKDISGFDAKHKVITNLSAPLNYDDAISKRYLKQVLANFGYSVYENLYKGRAGIVPANEWKAKVLEQDWKDLFKLN